MHNNDLLILLSKFSKKEMKEFDVFMKRRSSPTSAANKLLTFIRKQHPVFESTKCTVEKAHAFVFKKKTFKRTDILNAISDIRKELKKYLVYNHHEGFSYEHGFILLQLYKKYKLDKLFDKQLDAMRRELQQSSQKDMWSSLKEMQLAHEHYYHMSTKRRTERSELRKAMEQLDLFYAAAKLKYSSEWYNGFQILDEEEPDISFLVEIEKADWEKTSLYHYCYKIALKMIRTREESLYRLLKGMFIDLVDQIKQEDQYVLITYLLNHTSYEIRKGKEAYEKESFELLQFGFKRQIFSINGKIDPVHFINMVEVSTNLKEFNWATDFIKVWSSNLEPSTREYYVLLCEALIEFRRKNFKLCSSILAKVDLKEPQDELRGRWLKIIVHYEEEKKEDRPENFILNQCTAFEKFVQRNKLIHQKRKNAVKLFTKVLRLVLNVNADKAKILGILDSAEDFHYKSWLYQKVEEL